MKPDISAEMHLANGFADYVASCADKCNAIPSARELVWRVARVVSQATSEGHACVILKDIAPTLSLVDGPEIRNLLLSSGVVGTPDAPASMPLILDNDGRIYLHRYFEYERRLADRLCAAHDDSESANVSTLREQLNALFGASSDAQNTNWQKIAAALALRQRLTIISGGPGTGKTTTVVNLLACLLEQNRDCRIALTAPTGKAAARMQEAIRRNATHLNRNLQANLPQESFTVHRLLGVMPPDGNFKHHAGNLLPIDALIVDEASMLDISLAAHLFDAVPLHAHIILLGDMDQLSAVEAGAVFSDLSADPSLSTECKMHLSDVTGIAPEHIAPALPKKLSPLQDSVVWLSKSFRFSHDSGIGKLARHINTGQSEEALACLASSDETSINWLQDGDSTLSPSTLAKIRAEYEPFLEAVHSNPCDIQAAFDAFDRYRILCAVREGERGVLEINRQISRWFQSNEQAAWFPGRPVVILRNDYLLKLFNGDIGIALPDISGETNKMKVYFPGGQNQFRAIDTARLPEHETAFSMTVHKAQGSEFDSILLLLPSKHGKVLSRELLYTAITRARTHVTIISSADVLRQMIASPTQRNSGLIRRIEDACKSKEKGLVFRPGP